jgi:hypothetical protein
MMTPKVGQVEYVDVTAAMNEGAIGKEITLNVLMNGLFDEEEQR